MLLVTQSLLYINRDFKKWPILQETFWKAFNPLEEYHSTEFNKP